MTTTKLSLSTLLIREVARTILVTGELMADHHEWRAMCAVDKKCRDALEADRNEIGFSEKQLFVLEINWVLEDPTEDGVQQSLVDEMIDELKRVGSWTS